MKININGVTREMTPVEIAEMERLAAEMPVPEPTPEERISKLEQENAYLKEALNMLLEGVIDDAESMEG
jgi:hypothetical protein